MPLTTLSRLKAHLGVTSDSENARLQALLCAASEEIKGYCGQYFERASYVEYHDGNGTRHLILRQRPVISVESVRLDFGANYGATAGSFASSTELEEGVDWALRLDGEHPAGTPVGTSGLLVRIRSLWPESERIYIPSKLFQPPGPALGNIKVEYTAGYDPIPEDLQYAVALVAQYMRQTAPTAGYLLTGERIGDYNYELNPHFHEGLQNIGSVRRILQRYRELAV